MIKRFFYIFSATLFIMLSTTTGVQAEVMEKHMEALERNLNSPPGFNYQAVLRNNDGSVMASASVTLRFTVSNEGGNLWRETHSVTTDANGLVTAVIGDGTKTGGSASSFDEIDWGASDASLKVEVDSGNGFVDLGTNALQSVPYAAHAANVPTSIDDLADGSGDATLNGVFTANELAVAGAFNLPTIAGTDGQVLTTDGAGTTSWADASGGAYAGTGAYTFVAGYDNSAESSNSTVGGGASNAIGAGVSNTHATIGGGSGNNIVFSAPEKYATPGNSTISGGSNNYINSKNASIGGGAGNSIGVYSNNSTVGGGSNNEANGSGTTISGGMNNTIGANYQAGSYSAIAGGRNNVVQGNTLWGFIGGGVDNDISGLASATIGGKGLQTSSFGAAVVGLYNNTTSGTGGSHVATDPIFVVGNGTSLGARADAMVVLKNGNTDVNGAFTANSLGVEGQFTLPTTDGTSGQVLQTDGSGNVTWEDAGGASYAGTGSGSFNAGFSSSVTGVRSSIGGGQSNTITTYWSAISGGHTNTINASGANSLATAQNSIAGGKQNTITGAYTRDAFVGGGYKNEVSGRSAATVGGWGLETSSLGATVVGTYNATIGGTPSSAVDTDAMFIVGNGTDDLNRSDAMIVRKDGAAIFKDSVAVEGNLHVVGTFTNPSDKRLKKDIVDITGVLERLVQLEGYRYRYNDIKSKDTETVHFGVIAQELKVLYPELVKQGDDGYLSVNYMGLIPLLLEAVKELNAQNQTLMAENDQLEKTNSNLEVRQSKDEERFSELESKLNKLMMLVAPVDMANND